MIWKLKTGFIRDWNRLNFCYRLHLYVKMEIEDRIYTGLKQYLSYLSWWILSAMEIEDRIYTGLKHGIRRTVQDNPGIWKLKTGFIRDWNNFLVFCAKSIVVMEIEDRIYTGLKQDNPARFLTMIGYGNWRPDLYGIETYWFHRSWIYLPYGNWRPDLYGIETFCYFCH